MESLSNRASEAFNNREKIRFRSTYNGDVIMTIFGENGGVIGKAIVGAKEVKGELTWFVISYTPTEGKPIMVYAKNTGIYKEDSIKCLIGVLETNHPPASTTTSTTGESTTSTTAKMATLYGSLYTPNI